jgi:Lysylphosphatidylglycerol synthase TM region/O-Antigen ligase
MTILTRLAVSVGLLAAVVWAVWSISNPTDIAEAISHLTWQLIATIIVLLALGIFLSSLRLKLLALDQGYSLSIQDAMLALTVGQLVGSFFFQMVGQFIGRTAVFARRGIPAAASVVLFAYERFFAVLVSFGLAASGAIYLFGGIHLDLSAGGGSLIRLGIGLMAAIGAGAAFAWRESAASLLDNMSARHLMKGLRNGGLSLAIQLTTLAAYVLIGRALSPGVPLPAIVAASCIIMFAASLPVSLGGWGLREMSALFVLQAIHFSAAAALIVGLVIGVLSLVVLGTVASLLALLDNPSLDASIGAAERPPDYGIVLDWLLPIAAASAVFFQIYIPTPSGRINVNLADPIVIICGGLFVLRHISLGWPQWRVPSVNVYILLTSIVVALSFVHGLAVFGYTQWAFTNRTVGWIMLLCYAAAGALIVQRARWSGLEVLLSTIVATAVAVTLVDGAGLVFSRLQDYTLLDEVERISGFSQNPNAFGFMMLMALAAVMALGRQKQLSVSMLVIVTLGLFASQSRAALVAAPVMVALAAWCGVGLRPILQAFAVATSVAGAFYFAPSLHSFLLEASAAAAINLPSGNLPPVYDGPPDVERLSTVKDGITMFLAHPIFGAGLGAYAYERLHRDGYVQVIHSTPIWLLAETGIAGAAVFAAAAFRILRTEWTRRTEPAALLILLVLCALGIMSIFHELLYQRALWLVLGAALALPPLFADAQVGPSGQTRAVDL